MSGKISRLKNNIPKAFRGAKTALSHPVYLILAIIFAWLISALIYFSINMNFYGSLFLSDMLIGDKLSALNLMMKTMLTSYFIDSTGLLLLAVSLVQGVALALLVYNFRNSKQVDSKAVAGGGLAAIAAIVGLGCVPCGTSLLIPIMTLVFSSSSYLLLDAANSLVLIAALVLSFYALYKTGLIIHINQLTATWEKELDGKKFQKNKWR